MERGVVCEVTPISLVLGGEGLLNIRRTYRGISVITPLSIRRGAGGEASVGWQSAQSSLSLLAHISSPQKAFGIQRTQSVLAKIGCKAL